jgi:hypothetical protein
VGPIIIPIPFCYLPLYFFFLIHSPAPLYAARRAPPLLPPWSNDSAPYPFVRPDDTTPHAHRPAATLPSPRQPRGKCAHGHVGPTSAVGSLVKLVFSASLAVLGWSWKTASENCPTIPTKRALTLCSLARPHVFISLKDNYELLISLSLRSFWMQIFC